MTKKKASAASKQDKAPDTAAPEKPETASETAGSADKDEDGGKGAPQNSTASEVAAAPTASLATMRDDLKQIGSALNHIEEVNAKRIDQGVASKTEHSRRLNNMALSLTSLRASMLALAEDLS